jgi:hypothetical protein
MSELLQQVVRGQQEPRGAEADAILLGNTTREEQQETIIPEAVNPVADQRERLCVSPGPRAFREDQPQSRGASDTLVERAVLIQRDPRGVIS